MTYKAINTLDLVGYKTEKYRKNRLDICQNGMTTLNFCAFDLAFLDSQQSDLLLISRSLRIGWRIAISMPVQIVFFGVLA